MSRSLTSYVHRADGHAVLASEITPADLEAGTGGAVGDFWVVRTGFSAQHWERDVFHNAYEKLASDDIDADDRTAARAALEQLVPAPAALEGNAVVDELEAGTSSHRPPAHKAAPRSRKRK